MASILIDSHYYTMWTPQVSGGSPTGVLTPQFLVFRENSGSPFYTGGVNTIVGFTGVYLIDVPVLNLLGFNTGESYSVWATGMLSGQPIREFINRITPHRKLFNGISGIATTIYHAQIDHCYVKPSGLDRWTVLWYKNGNPYTVWSTGRLSVINYTGGVHFNSSGLTAYGAGISGGRLSVGGSLILQSGQKYIAKTTAFIDGTTRQWEEHVGYDV